MPFKIPGDLHCDEPDCDKAYLARDTWPLTLAGATVSGWRVFHGTLNSGDPGLLGHLPPPCQDSDASGAESVRRPTESLR